MHVALLAYSAVQHSPTRDEPAHLAAGLNHWTFLDFRLYSVNPPLVRMVAAVPVLAAGPQLDWRRDRQDLTSRPEFALGEAFGLANGEGSLRYLTLARWACIPFSVIGAVACYLWAKELHGQWSAMVAILLWCVSPNILAHGQLITPDAAAISGGVLATYLFWRWLELPRWGRAGAAGAALAFALLLKTTWIIFLPLWPLLWVVCRARKSKEAGGDSSWAIQGCQLSLIGVMGLYLLNLGYLFEGTLTPLGDYRFASHALRGDDAVDYASETGHPLGNRFRSGFLSGVPLPFPKHYVIGADLQKLDFERGDDSYLRGEWRHGGWWHYYLYGLAVKTPIGAWLVGLVAAGFSFAPFRWREWRDHMVLLVPPVILFLLVSSQTGFNHHLRYVLPMFGFLIVWMSRAGCSLNAVFAARPVKIHYSARVAAKPLHVAMHTRLAAAVTVIGLTWTTVSSLSVYPHSLSYFNVSAHAYQG